MAQDRRKRLRVTVSPEDRTVLDWLKAQESVSFSVKQLIKAYVAANGFTDVMTGPLFAGGQLPVMAASSPVPAVEPDNGSAADAEREAKRQETREEPKEPEPEFDKGLTPVRPLPGVQAETPAAPAAKPADNGNEGLTAEEIIAQYMG